MGPSQKNTDLLPSPSERVSDRNWVLSKIKGYRAEGVTPHWAIAPRTWPPTSGRHQGASSQLQGWDHSQPGLTALSRQTSSRPTPDHDCRDHWGLHHHRAHETGCQATSA